MKQIFLIVFSFIIISGFAQDYKELIKNVPGLDKYPDASAVNVYTQIDINLHGDGSYSKHVYYIKKILNYKGKNRYSDLKIGYNDNFESVELGECFTIRNGEKISLPKEATHDNENFMTMVSPEFINKREKVVNFPAIEPNDFIVVDYIISSHPKTFFSGTEHMQEANPYIKKTFSITAEQSVKLNYLCDSAVVKFNKTINGHKVTYSWLVKDMPMIKPEKNSPSYSVVGKPVFYSVYSKWPEAIKMFFDRQNSVDYNTREVKALAKKVTKDTHSEIARIQAIYKYFQDNFLMKYSLKEDLLKPSPAKEVIARKYGTTQELTNLYIAMCKAVDAKVKLAYFIKPPEVEGIATFPSKAFIRIPVAEYNGTLISLSSSTIQFGYVNYEKGFYILSDDMSKMHTYLFDTKGLITKKIKITLGENGSAKASFDKVLRGSKDFSLRRQFKDETDKKRRIWFSSNISDKSIVLTSGPVFNNLKNPFANLEITYEADIQHFYRKQGNYNYFKLPERESIGINLAGDMRNNPFEIKNTVSIIEQYVIENIPSGASVIKPKTEIKKVFKVNGLEMIYEVSAEVRDGKIFITRKIFIPKTIISVEDYKAFYNFMSQVNKPLNNMVFINIPI